MCIKWSVNHTLCDNAAEDYGLGPRDYVRGSMAAKDREREYDFIEQPPEEFFCPVTFAVLLEPYLTQCCGNHLSQEAYQRLQGQPCPVCREENLVAMKDKFHRRRMSLLKMRCPHKAEGCEWQGELRSLEHHLNTNRECRYVDVDCPYACGERVQRRSLKEHKSQRCPLRPFTCQYCKHKATHQKMTKEHWPVCEKYPLTCPNKCGMIKFERQHLKGHLEQTCPLEAIQCDFSYAGCGAQLQRRLMSAHMKKGMEAHLSLLSLVVQEVPKLQNTVQQQADLIKQQGDQMNQMVDLIKQQGDQIKQQGDQIKQLQKPFPQFDIILDGFDKHKKSNDEWFSPPFYTHLGGYRICLRVHANGVGTGKGTHVSVYVFLMRGEYDDLLKWPFRGDVTIQLKKNDPPHHQMILPLNDDTPNKHVCKPTKERNDDGWGYGQYISHADLYAGGYLKDNKLVFCVSDIASDLYM